MRTTLQQPARGWRDDMKETFHAISHTFGVTAFGLKVGQVLICPRRVYVEPTKHLEIGKLPFEFSVDQTRLFDFLLMIAERVHRDFVLRAGRQSLHDILNGVVTILLRAIVLKKFTASLIAYLVVLCLERCRWLLCHC